MKLPQSLASSRSLEIRIKKSVFANGDIVAYAPKNDFSLIEPVIPKSYIQYLQDELGPSFITYGQDFPNNWRCVCGFINDKASSNCSFCQRASNFVLEQLNKDTIENHIQANNKPISAEEKLKKDSTYKASQPGVK